MIPIIVLLAGLFTMALHLLHIGYMMVALFTADSIGSYWSMLKHMALRILSAHYISHLFVLQLTSIVANLENKNGDLFTDRREDLYLAFAFLYLYLREYIRQWNAAYRIAVTPDVTPM